MDHNIFVIVSFAHRARTAQKQLVEKESKKLFGRFSCIFASPRITLATSYISRIPMQIGILFERWPKLLYNVIFDSMITQAYRRPSPLFLHLTNVIVYDAYDAYIGSLIHDNAVPEMEVLLKAFDATSDVTCQFNRVTLRITFSYF